LFNAVKFIMVALLLLTMMLSFLIMLMVLDLSH